MNLFHFFSLILFISPTYDCLTGKQKGRYIDNDFQNNWKNFLGIAGLYKDMTKYVSHGSNPLQNSIESEHVIPQSSIRDAKLLCKEIKCSPEIMKNIQLLEKNQMTFSMLRLDHMKTKSWGSETKFKNEITTLIVQGLNDEALQKCIDQYKEVVKPELERYKDGIRDVVNHYAKINFIKSDQKQKIIGNDEINRGDSVEPNFVISRKLNKYLRDNEKNPELTSRAIREYMNHQNQKEWQEDQHQNSEDGQMMSEENSKKSNYETDKLHEILEKLQADRRQTNKGKQKTRGKQQKQNNRIKRIQPDSGYESEGNGSPESSNEISHGKETESVKHGESVNGEVRQFGKKNARRKINILEIRRNVGDQNENKSIHPSETNKITENKSSNDREKSVTRTKNKQTSLIKSSNNVKSSKPRNTRR